MKTVTRRQFLKMTAGAGLSLAVAATPLGYRLLSAEEMKNEAFSFSPNVWLNILPDNTVIVVVNKSEMGQGVYTSLPMIVADELDADWKNVKMVTAPAGDAFKDPVWGSQSTGGSSSIRHMYEPLRMAGAAAREMLLTAASQEWGVPATECAVLLGRVKHIKSSRSLTYGNLSVRASKLPVPQKPTLKKESQLRYIGTSVPRLDMHDKVNGTALFGTDIFVPDMLYVAITRPPVFGAALAGV